jgi:hypothetical protein
MNLPMPRSPHALIFLSLNFSVWIRRRCTSTKEEPRNEPKTFRYASFVNFATSCKNRNGLWLRASVVHSVFPTSVLCHLPFAICHLPSSAPGPWSVVRGPWSLFCAAACGSKSPFLFRVAADHRRSRLRIRANSCQFVQFVSAAAKPRFGPSRGSLQAEVRPFPISGFPVYQATSNPAPDEFAD